MNWFWDNIHLKKEERAGMLVFICIIFCLLLIKWYMVVMYTPRLDFYNSDILAKIEYTFVEPIEKEKKEKDESSFPAQKKRFVEKNKNRSNQAKKTVKRKKHVFDFDPNLLSEDSLRLLGFSKYVTNNIVKYRASGGRFKHADDLQKVYGLDSVFFKEIYSLIDIIFPKTSPHSKKVDKKSVVSEKPKLALKSIDINLADTTEFKKIKGIGSVYANRIVKFRNSLGGYFSIDQIREVWGISDSLFLEVKPYLSMGSSTLQKRNINLLDKDLLAKHPYIDWRKAKIITNYKKMHGDFKSMEDFKKLHGIEEGFLDTLTQYFIAE